MENCLKGIVAKTINLLILLCSCIIFGKKLYNYEKKQGKDRICK